MAQPTNGEDPKTGATPTGAKKLHPTTLRLHLRARPCTAQRPRRARPSRARPSHCARPRRAWPRRARPSHGSRAMRSTDRARRALLDALAGSVAGSAGSLLTSGVRSRCLLRMRCGRLPRLRDFAAAGKSTPVGFEPTRGDPIGLAGRRLNRSAKVSYAHADSQRTLRS